LEKKLSKKYNSISKMIRENSLMKPTRFLIQVYFAHHPTKYSMPACIKIASRLKNVSDVRRNRVLHVQSSISLMVTSSILRNSPNN